MKYDFQKIIKGGDGSSRLQVDIIKLSDNILQVIRQWIFGVLVLEMLFVGFGIWHLGLEKIQIRLWMHFHYKCNYLPCKQHKHELGQREQLFSDLSHCGPVASWL